MTGSHSGPLLPLSAWEAGLHLCLYRHLLPLPPVLCGYLRGWQLRLARRTQAARPLSLPVHRCPQDPYLTAACPRLAAQDQSPGMPPAQAALGVGRYCLAQLSGICHLLLCPAARR